MLIHGYLILALIIPCGAILHVLPDVDPLWIADSMSLELSCFGDKDIAWYKDDVSVISNNDVIVTKHFATINGVEHYKTIINIRNAKIIDSGQYVCIDGTHNKTKRVRVVRGKLTSNLSGKITAFEGDSLVLFCKYEGNIKLKLSWYKNGEEELSKYGFTSRKQTFRRDIVTSKLKTSKEGITVTDGGIYQCKAGPLMHSFTLNVLKYSCDDRLIAGPFGVSKKSITASSYYKDILHDNSPYCAKMNQTVCDGWSPLTSNDRQWIQISFPTLKIIRDFIMLGRQKQNGGSEWVTSYTLTYSYNGMKWLPYSSDDTNQTVLEGNLDSPMHVSRKRLPVPIVTKYVRVHPRSWEGMIALRLELLGCTLPTEIRTDDELKGINVPDPLLLTCNITGPAQPNIVWYKDGTRLIGSSGYEQTTNWTWYDNRIESSSFLKKTPTAFEDSGKYTCRDIVTGANRTIKVTAAQLDIEPSASSLWVMEGHHIVITCKYTGAVAMEIVWLNMNILQNSGYIVSMNKKVESGVSMTTSTIRKQAVSMADSTYISCTVGNLQRQIEVKVIQEQKQVEVLEKGSKELNLHCNVDEVLGPKKTILDVYWTRNQKPLGTTPSSKEKFQLSPDSRTITIYNPDTSMAGLYECNVMLEVGKNEKQVFPITVEVHALPELELNGQEKVTEGDTLHLYCKVTGYPLPPIAWYKDGTKVSNTDARHNFIPYLSVENGHLVMFDVNLDDTGKYECKDETKSNNSTRSILYVTVKDISLADNLLMVSIVVSATTIVLAVFCCLVCMRCRQKSKQRPDLCAPPSQQYSQPLLIKRYVDMEVVTRTKSLTSIEEIDQLPLPPPPVDPWEDTSTVDGGSMTYERIPKMRDRCLHKTDTLCTSSA